MTLDSFILRGCKRCGGALALNLVEVGEYHCLQCGHRRRAHHPTTNTRTQT